MSILWYLKKLTFFSFFSISIYAPSFFGVLSKTERDARYINLKLEEKKIRQQQIKKTKINELIKSIQSANNKEELNKFLIDGINISSIDVVKEAIQFGANNLKEAYLLAKSKFPINDEIQIIYEFIKLKISAHNELIRKLKQELNFLPNELSDIVRNYYHENSKEIIIESD